MGIAEGSGRRTSYDLSHTARPYLFETLPDDLFARLDTGGAPFPLFHRAGAVGYHVEIRLLPGAGHERELSFACRKGFAVGAGAVILEGRERFRPVFFELSDGRGAARACSLRGPLDAVYGRLCAAPVLRGRLAPLTGDLLAAWPSLLVSPESLDSDLFLRAFAPEGAALPAAAGRNRVTFALRGRIEAGAAALSLAGPEGFVQEARFELRSMFLDREMAVSTRAADFAEALLVLLARCARRAAPGGVPLTVAPRRDEAFASRELALFDGWLAAVAPPPDDPDLARFDLERRKRLGQ